MLRGNFFHPLRHSKERILRREDPIFLNILKNKDIKNKILAPSQSEDSG
jgi:hypothetical protein